VAICSGVLRPRRSATLLSTSLSIASFSHEAYFFFFFFFAAFAFFAFFAMLPSKQ
jgi:hypothetical protein